MLIKMGLAEKSFVANVALIWLLSRVYSYVFIEIPCFAEGTLANVAFVWFFSRMYSHMLIEIPGLVEGKPANVTLVWFFFQSELAYA